MPTVQRYGNRRIATEPLVSVRKQSAETPTSTGAGLADAQGQTARQVEQLGATVTHIATQQIAEMQAKERQRANDVASMEYDTSLSKWSNDRLMNPETGALTVMGKAAMGQPEKVLAEFDQVAGGLEANLHTDEQRARARKIRAQHRDNLDVTLQRHTFDQVKRYEAEVVGATVETAHETAAANATDPRRVGVELQKGVEALTAAAPRFGWSPEVLHKKIADFNSTTHTDVIERLVDAKLTMQARVYFEEKGAEITDPKAHARVMDMLKVGTDQAEALTAADAIIAAGGTRAEQMAKAKELKPEIREHAERRIEHELAVKKVAEQEAEGELLDRVYARLGRNGGDMRSVSASEQEKLGRHLPGIEAWALRQAKGLPTETDQMVYYMLKEAATTDPDAFLQTNLLTFKNKLSDSDFQELTGLRGAIRSGNKAASSKVLDDFRTEHSVVTNALTLAGIDATPASDDTEGQKRIAQFHGLIANEVNRVQGVTGKKLSHDELDAIANRILAKQITDKGWFYDSSRSLATATPADIPAADRAQIVDSLTRAGRPVTPEAALQVWLRAQARKGGK